MGNIFALVCLFAISVVFFILWLVMSCWYRGFRQGHTSTARGQLTHFDQKKNARIAHINKWDDKTHKWIRAAYTYEVEGKKYSINCIVIDRHKPLPASTEIVYQIKKPKYAYSPEFQTKPVGDNDFLLFFAGVFFLIGMLLQFS